MGLREYYKDALKCVLFDEGITEPSEDYVDAVVDGILNARENESTALYIPSTSDHYNQKIRDLEWERDCLKENLSHLYREDCPICHGHGVKKCGDRSGFWEKCEACEGSGKLWRVSE